MIIQWIKDITLNIIIAVDKDEVIDQCDEEMKARDKYEVDFVEEHDNLTVDMQFGDGSMAFGVSRGSFINVTALWESLGNVPIDEDECIDEDWNGFSKGTHREDIWHFFEDTYNVSVAKDLMGISNSPE